MKVKNSCYFGAKSNEGYYNKNKNFRSYFLTFDSGARLEIMNKPDLDDPEKTLNRTGYIHVAFSFGSLQYELQPQSSPQLLYMLLGKRKALSKLSKIQSTTDHSQKWSVIDW